METTLWQRIKHFVKFSYEEQKAETCGGIFMGLALGWHWVFAFVPAWMGTFLTPLIPIIKGMVASAASSLAMNTVSYLFKKYTNSLNDDRPKRARRKKRGDKAA